MATFAYLEKTVLKHNPKANIELIRKAYEFAREKHKNQKRESGEPFIHHPLETALILANLKWDDTTIIAGLLHDVVEDTGTQLKELKESFGEVVARIVDGVTKIESIEAKSKEERSAETLRKIILTATDDIRVIFVKLADKLHNLRTISSKPIEYQWQFAQDILEIYAPIAYKIGLGNMKTEMEDSAFNVPEPEKHREISDMLKKTRKQREEETARFKRMLERGLEKKEIKAVILARPKSVYSIYKKMCTKKVDDISHIYDLIGLRVITPTVGECYEILGVVCNDLGWKPVPERFKDYIAMRKPNMYQSLHVTALGPKGELIEVQIRTEEMHRIAEEGIAAHWKYKGIDDKGLDEKLPLLKQLIELKQNGGAEDINEFIDLFKRELFEDNIFVFTPKGRIVTLPEGSCIIDFAYAVHSDLGNHCIAAKVNDKFVPLRTVLKNGDNVYVLTQKNQVPSGEWLKFVKTSKARAKIKQIIKSLGKIPVRSYNSKQKLKSELAEWIINVDTMTKPIIKLAKCCNPCPGDEIIGYATGANKVSVHLKDCAVPAKQKKKKVNVRWLDNPLAVVEIKVKAVNRTGVFAEILNALLSSSTQMKGAKANLLKKGIVECSFGMETRGLEHLREAINRIKKIRDVKEVNIGGIC
ncbi:bifunctional (p)ppGpp synthetase/guanosine-3',5'-bis(diphosphate) 3'-pyrophosphohydrolase [archaeon]|nr:bifunctional (p)ppGpp synthetase/guanosine-3',5'-bis(diphosphate) 3'-pyrophosphohydrolase [archaeon]